MINPTILYLTIAIIGFVLILIALFLRRKQKNELSRLTVLALLLVTLGGVVENRIFGYTFIGLGIIVVLFEFIRNKKTGTKKHTESDFS